MQEQTPDPGEKKQTAVTVTPRPATRDRRANNRKWRGVAAHVAPLFGPGALQICVSKTPAPDLVVIFPLWQ